MVSMGRGLGRIHRGIAIGQAEDNGFCRPGLATMVQGSGRLCRAVDVEGTGERGIHRRLFGQSEHAGRTQGGKRQFMASGRSGDGIGWSGRAPLVDLGNRPSLWPGASPANLARVCKAGLATDIIPALGQ